MTQLQENVKIMVTVDIDVVVVLYLLVVTMYCCDSCDTIEYIEFSASQLINGVHVYVKTWWGLYDGEFLLAIYLSF